MHNGRVKRTWQLVALMTIALMLLLSVSLAFFKPHNVRAADISGSYTWKPMKIGGGGFVTGMALHPTTPNIIYARTDTAGAYRWDASTGTWSEMLLTTNVPDPAHTVSAVESIAVSKTNDQVVYVAVGDDLSNQTGRILKSTDRGNTWADGGHRWYMGGNSNYRMGGERLAVDPNNGNIVYFGSRKEGLWISTDGGSTWTQISTSQVPVGSNSGDPAGIDFVTFDPTSGTTSGKTNRIYVGVADVGVYVSNDAGASWQLLLSKTSSVPFMSVVASDETLFVGFENSGDLQKYTPSSNTWTDILTACGDCNVTVNPFNPQEVVVGDGGVKTGNFWVSTNGGSSWTTPTLNLSSPTIPWILNTDEYLFLTSAWLHFDPTVNGKLWFPQGTGVWVSTNVTSDPLTFTFTSTGIENTVANDVIAPPGGKPVTAIADRNGFYHANPDASPQRTILTDKFSDGTSLDYSGGTPSFIAAVSSDTRNLNPDQSGYSTDGGQTWTQFAGSRGYPDLYGGNIAVSASNTSHIVWLPTNNKKPFYTTDRGATWTQSSGLSTVSVLHTMIWWGSKKALDADKVQGDTFYLYSTDNNGQFYRSTDGGSSWQLVAVSPSAPPSNNDAHVFGQIHAAPGHANDVWASQAQGGLWHTTDGGTTWYKVSAVQDARGFGFGMAMNGSTYPTIYMHGTVNNQPGIWRSTDQGGSWDLLSPAPLSLLSTITAVNGDMNIAGRVYVAYSGASFAYGDQTGTVPTPTPGGSTPTPTPTPTPPPQANVAAASSAPTIDGSGSDAVWNSASSYQISNVLGSPTNFSASFQTAWDSNNLYFLVKTNDATYSSHADMVEVYLDPNHDGGLTYDSKDMQYQFPSDTNTVSQYNGGSPGTNTSGIVFAKQTTASGYVTEISIPWARLSTTPAANTSMGLEIDVWQNYTSGNKNKVMWSFTTDDAWHNPSLFGTATLQSGNGSTSWQSQDIGAVGLTGSSSYSNGTFTVAGSGADIFNSADAFRYVYQPFTGDGTIVAKVTGIQNTDPWAKVGVMMRETLDAGSKHAFMMLTSGYGMALEGRSTTGGGTSNIAGPGGTAPYWLMLLRAGTTFTGYVSSDGNSWTMVGSESINMASTLYIGLAVTSHNNTLLNTSTFSNVSINPGGVQRLEAENAALSGGAAVNNNHANYSGTGFVDGYWNQGAATTFTVNVASSGTYAIDLRYANSYNSVTQTLSIYVNGVKVKQTSLAFLSNWDTWGDQTETLNLNAGSNTIAYKYDTGDTGNVNLDDIVVSPA